MRISVPSSRFMPSMRATVFTVSPSTEYFFLFGEPMLPANTSPVLMATPMASVGAPRRPRPVQLGQRLLHAQRGLHRVPGVIGIVERRGIDREDPVADEIVDEAA